MGASNSSHDGVDRSAVSLLYLRIKVCFHHLVMTFMTRAESG